MVTRAGETHSGIRLSECFGHSIPVASSPADSSDSPAWALPEPHDAEQGWIRPCASATSVIEPASNGCDDCWELLPSGLMYHSYIAGPKEPRVAAVWLSEKDRGLVWETAVGGRAGILRHGTPGCGPNPQGFQLDVEGAALVRIDHEEESDVEAADFRIGLIGTWRRNTTATKFGYSHISSHVGDEFLIKNPGFERINYVRDSLIFGVYEHVTPELGIYGEIGYALNANGGAEPLEFQFGTEYRPVPCNRWNISPVFAINAGLREELQFGGGVNVIAALEARGRVSDSRFRVGLQYYNGKELQYSFLQEDVQFIGAGLWFDN